MSNLQDRQRWHGGHLGHFVARADQGTPGPLPDPSAYLTRYGAVPVPVDDSPYAVRPRGGVDTDSILALFWDDAPSVFDQRRTWSRRIQPNDDRVAAQFDRTSRR